MNRQSHMRVPKINLLGDHQIVSSQRGQPKRRGFTILWLAAIFVVFFGLGRLSLSETAAAALEGLGDISILRQMQLIGSPDRLLVGESDDRINVLLMGMGGEGHDGPLLTDTMILVSFRPSDRRVALLSVPRDLMVPITDVGWRKINAANAYGEMRTRGAGGDFARTAVSQVLGLDIPYYVRIDFNGFQKIIDDLGGLDIAVDREFTDRAYPTSNYGYQVVHFQAGWQHMSGDEALKFARSRHGNNGEGSDFARAMRQQKVLSALKEKLMSLKTLRSPATISNLLASFQANVATNLQVGEMLRLARLAKDVSRSDISHTVLDDSADSPLVSRQINGAWMLLPKGDDWTGLRRVAADLFAVAPTDTEKPAEEAPPAAAPAAVATTPASIEIQNGSGRSGLAREVAGRLGEAGFVVKKIGNAGSFTYRQTTVYDLTSGRRATELKDLTRLLGSGTAVAKPNLKLLAGATEGIDFLVILGQDDSEI